MRLKSFLYSSSVLVLLALPAMAEPLAPRGEVSVKGGTDRSLLTTEFWAPLAQQSDRVLYGDIRLMGDNDENREGNLGLGYRQIKNDAVIGVHGWIDRRRTQHNSTFHQLTFGVERLGHVIDARANVYVPINNGRNIITRNIGVTNPYLVGSGIYYDTNGSINETPQYGVDGELGYRIPVWQKQVDAIRVYGGGYYFFRDNTLEVPGARFRTEAQVNKIFSVGARVQYDKPRGTQGFLEATLKFPFSAKRLYQESGIRSRLDESPERDVDIVTDAKVDTGLFKPVINTASGSQQRILYVDNSKTDSGDGSYEKPFNSLKSAEAALQAHDILYVNRGDGTTRNMDQGIVIDRANVQLIGSGSALTYGGAVLLNAGAAPIITNNTSPSSNSDYYTGNGVLIIGQNSAISGISITGSGGNGIRAMADGTDLGNVSISNVNTSANKATGIYAIAINGGHINNLDISRTVSNNNILGVFDPGNSHGIMARADGIGSKINTYIIDQTTANNNVIIGFVAQAIYGGEITRSIIKNSVAMNNGYTGIYNSIENGGKMSSLTIDTNNSSNNLGMGISVQAATGTASRINSVNIANNITSGNANTGIHAQSGNGSLIDSLTINGNVSNSNLGSNGYGILVRTTSANSKIDNVLVTDNTLRANNKSGLLVYANNGNINNATISSNTSNNNTEHGHHILAAASGTISQLITSGVAADSNGFSGLSVQGGNGTISDATIENVTTNSNIQYGIFFQATNNGAITKFSLNTATANGNSISGIHVQTDTNAGSKIDEAVLKNITASNNTSTGVIVNMTSGTIGNLELSNITASSNINHGIGIYASGTGALNSAILKNNTIINNTRNGLYLYATGTSIMNNITISNNMISNNVERGVFVNNDSTGTFLTDFGGGTLNSSGLNSIHTNTLGDIRVDVNGGQLKAQHNWWGVNTGLAGGRVSYEDASSIDASNFLTTAP